MLIEATHTCGHTSTKTAARETHLTARWKARIKRTTCMACRLAAMEAALQALDAAQLREVVRKCHNVPRLMQVLHKAATK